MNKTIWTAACLAAVLGVGCNSDHPGNWSPAQIESQVLDSLDLAEVTLSPAEDTGVFRGTGTDASGERFELTVYQDEAKQEIRWEAIGNRGTNETGSYSFVD